MTETKLKINGQMFEQLENNSQTQQIFPGEKVFRCSDCKSLFTQSQAENHVCEILSMECEGIRYFQVTNEKYRCDLCTKVVHNLLLRAHANSHKPKLENIENISAKTVKNDVVPEKTPEKLVREDKKSSRSRGKRIEEQNSGLSEIQTTGTPKSKRKVKNVTNADTAPPQINNSSEINLQKLKEKINFAKSGIKTLGNSLDRKSDSSGHISQTEIANSNNPTVNISKSTENLHIPSNFCKAVTKAFAKNTQFDKPPQQTSEKNKEARTHAKTNSWTENDD